MARRRTAIISTRLLSLVILLTLAAIVLHTPIATSGVAAGRATFCLGFILLFGYYVARMLEYLRVPMISSYIVAGVVCGPFLLNLLSAGVVTSLQVFDDVALAIIALIAGGEMRLRVLSARRAALASMIGGQIAFSFVGAMLVVLVLRGSLGLTMPTQNWPALVAVGLLFGLIMVARSPSTTIGIVAETRARGPLTEVLVGVTVILDVIVLLLAALIVPAAEALASENVHFSLSFARTMAVEVLGSIAAGVFFGVVVRSYIRWIGGYLPVFLLAIGLVGSLVCRHYHLEPLLAFMVAGFYIENFSAAGEELIKGLERSAFPVYVIFFAISGASIDLGALRAMWPLALVLVIVRGGAFFAGSWSAARMVKELRPHANTMWTGFLAQAGVTIGIATIIERRFAWGAEIKTLALAMVAINQLVGPVLLKLLLERKGEAGGMDR